MKSIIKLLSIAVASSLLLTACNDDNDNTAVVFYQQADQMGRPAINTVFNSSADKNTFNTTVPSQMNAAFQSKFQARLLALNANYTTNALTQTAAQLTGLLANDVLGVTLSNTTPTTFFDGTNVLTGRNLSDDVIDVELLLLFGGPNGTANPTLTKDGVNANDKAFLTTFPYLASPF